MNSFCHCYVKVVWGMLSDTCLHFASEVAIQKLCLVYCCYQYILKLFHFSKVQRKVSSASLNMKGLCMNLIICINFYIVTLLNV
jgi:hypothetical protein